ncbi:hypothetical protein SAMN05444521_0414 [Streptomyces sp. 3214.6]|nr:hypothetical protein SAMN05444521_0414 [Streptomyces sp. 3214.6]
MVNVRPDERIEPDGATKLAVTAAACRAVGWDFQRVDTPEAAIRSESHCVHRFTKR